MLSFPNAKINIGLQITEKRTDGFHNLESIFYPIQWNDALEVLESDELIFKSSGLEIPGDSANNLCLKAFRLLQNDFKIDNVSIHLHKNIPMGAGMGGGSADGAFMLILLNELYNLNLSNNELENYARKLGSDCAFFIENKPKFCFNKGDEFEAIEINLKDKYCMAINPSIHISTAEAYAGVVPTKSVFDLRTIQNLPFSDWKKYILNDFEKEILKNYPTLQELKNKMYELGAFYASMTGSGSTVYGIFDKKPVIDNNYAKNSVWIGKM
jgi:4-diphosphocytidyl-2-C-methyl-D-erythritol kinase